MSDCPRCFCPMDGGQCSNSSCGYAEPVPPPPSRVERKRAAARARAMASFDGATFDREKDQARLGVQLDGVRTVMSDGQWRTLAEIATHTGAPEASVSARIRDLRKPKFGGLHVESRRRAGASGLWEYRIHVCA